jgi:hypothetical protein
MKCLHIRNIQKCWREVVAKKTINLAKSKERCGKHDESAVFGFDVVRF